MLFPFDMGGFQGDRGAVEAHIEATNSAFIVIGTQNLLAEQWVPLFADLQDIKSQFIRDLLLDAFGEVRLEDVLGQGVDEAFVLFQQGKMLFIKASGNVMRHQFSGRGLFTAAGC